MSDDLREQVSSLPDSPGIYRFYDKSGTLIYVGKAKSLRKRVNSYFTKQSQYNRKTEKLVSEILNLEFTIANSEFDALLLENNFIKQYQPRYNILLKDDKTFPYLCILKEPFPRIIYTRKYIPQQGEYFGPYSSVVSMKSVLELVRKLYTIRTCNLALTQENIQKKKFKVCLEYHLGNCKGPCEGLQEELSYLEDIHHARNILRGNLSIVENHFRQEMTEAASQMEFERAEQYRSKLDLLDRFQAKSLVVNRKLTGIDVITITSTEHESLINFMQIREGAIVFSKNVEIRKKMDESDEELITMVAQQIRNDIKSGHNVVLSNVPLQVTDPLIENIVPVIGDKKKLIELSLKNVLYLKGKKEALRHELQDRHLSVLQELQKSLSLQQLPRIIECFDNSNFQGTDSVASMVRFVDGKPDKSGYRHFNIKSVQGPNDFASMKEIVGRRYSRLIDENKELPNLIIVDGGKGQLGSAVDALSELQLYGKIPVVGIAKRLEEIYYPNDPIPLHIHKKSQGLKLMQQIRDEAHRFAITFHRLKRSKSSLISELETIEGIGSKTIDILLQTFKSVKKILGATPEELEKAVGKSKSLIIVEWAKNKKDAV
ncbi:MAG: excinuclease ABC subunit C [Bacteroidetes bacterium]|nr:excinuclease ABC subunit C [Bacteroidota bacterium]